MVKQKNSSNVAAYKTFSRNRFAWACIGVLVLTILIVQTLITADLYKRHATDPTVIKTLITQAVQGIGKDVPIEATSGKLYMADYRLVLPSDRSIPTIRYSGWEESGLTLSSTAAVNQLASKMTGARTLEETFAVVPHLQACNRQYLLRFTPESEQDYKQIASKKLSDGRSLTIYKNTVCDAQVGQLDDYIKQIDSY